MNVTLLQENLVKALTRVGRIISPKAQLPIMQSVLLSVGDDKVTLSATSLELSEVTTVAAKIEKEGSLCVSGKLLMDLVVSLPQETVHLVVKEGSLHIRCGKVSAIIPGTPGTEFPPVPTLTKKTGVKLDKKEMGDALGGVLFAAATDEGRPLLTGVKMTKKDDDVMVVATDGYRLSLKRLPFKHVGELGVVVPARALSEVVKVMGEEKDQESIVMSQNEDGQLSFVIGDTEIHTRTIAGEYPDIEKIIPKTHNTRVLVDTAELSRAVKSASVFARDSANILRMHVENQVLVVSANTPQVGENHVEVDAKVDGDGGDIAFNSRFLLDLLNSFDENELLFEMTGSLNPGVFKKPKDQSYLHIIMPVRVSS